MSVKKILTTSKHEKLLRSKSEPVVKVNRDIKSLCKDLRDLMEAAGNGIGLAAVQIGVPKRVFAMRLGYTDAPLQDGEERVINPPIFLVNPEIVEASEEMTRGFDACLSIPSMMGYTDRHSRIRITYLDENGKANDRVFEGWDARVAQHEYDHLEGVLFMDRLRSVDDLYVLVPDEDGNSKQVPYRDVVKKATQQGGIRPATSPGT